MEERMKHSDKWYIDNVKARYAHDLGIVFDDRARVVPTDDPDDEPGAWVAAWIWETDDE